MKIDRLRYLKRVFNKDNAGFTLVEAVLCLAVLTIIAALMPLLYVNLYSVNHQLEESVHKEWDLFSIQFRKEVMLHDVEKVETRKLTLKSKEGDTIVFSFYGSLLRRQVNGTGHEVYLTAIKDLSFSSSDGMIGLEVKFINEKQREGRFMGHY
ncbi:competence type IV pilus minor pilin ComGF [Jeotgalibacillus sp. ET6]|uniref:competence type IV pilus minor pilin ComGF n=1 Tax=Jeotgalibacillus sp. ET6 TaxID=3037260 RepID=UPI0024187B23|nr:competence type IV pilus minor pilin ComGF [Jeotgalibacillus sp. ET6]MDG5470790.1 competence type IV pilus minor pilin ComGF [Jeotgalibacillus sp. ET6]